MDDLDRLFHQLVRAVAARGRERLGEPVQLSELYQELVPYRQYRNTLRFDTYQDYEMALLRLLAGERGYARVEPPEVQESLEAESQAAYPDPGAIREFAAARAYLDGAAARAVLASDDAYAPAALHPPSPREAAEAADAAGAVEAGAEAEPGQGLDAPGKQCPYCGAELPTGRAVVYCPFCGGNVRGRSCPECHTEVEVGWTFCITCGRKMGRG